MLVSRGEADALEGGSRLAPWDYPTQSWEATPRGLRKEGSAVGRSLAEGHRAGPGRKEGKMKEKPKGRPRRHEVRKPRLQGGTRAQGSRQSCADLPREKKVASDSSSKASTTY